MKSKFLAALAIVVLLLSSPCIFAAGTNDPTVELKALITKIRADIRAGKTTETALADDIKQYDVLLAEHKGEKTEAVARILYMKAALYVEVFHNDAKAAELKKQLKTEFQDTELVASLKKREARQAEAEKIQEKWEELTRDVGLFEQGGQDRSGGTVDEDGTDNT